jgi:predicted nucleotidyltransferase
VVDGRLFPDLPLLTDVERSCLSRYLTLVVDRLGDIVRRVVVFGSVARGETWPRGMPIRSDLDLLVVVRTAIPDEAVQELLDATFPLYLECGRQISPQFRTEEQLDREDELAATFRDHIVRDGVTVFRH